MSFRRRLRRLVKWFKFDSSTGVGGKGLADNAFGPFLPGHTPRLPREADADLGDAQRSCLITVYVMDLLFSGAGAKQQRSGNLKVGEA
jgi:hypothetical protein